jgi:hypothetical protein
MKEALISQGIKAYINHRFKEYGHMTSLHIDTDKKIVTITANLAGEPEPIHGQCQYRVEETDNRTYFVPLAVECSREWIAQLAQQLLRDKPARIEIPPGIASTAVKILGL